MEFTPLKFRDNVKQALADKQLGENLRGAVDFFAANRRRSVDNDGSFAQLKEQGRLIKQRCLLKLPQLLEQLERRLQHNGIQVHWAETPEQANRIIAKIIAEHNGKIVVKGKSMVSEETELNQYLLEQGVRTLETDMGEYIVQLENMRPSHIIAPAIHRNQQQVAELFAKHIAGQGYTEDVDSLIQAARQVMRNEFKSADVGITGVNFAVAQTGTLCLVENEGNGRMTSTLPKLHIAITGIEKVVETLDDIPPLLSLLTRSATGQTLSTYFNMISHPKRAGEKDGPEEVHLVLLDNGRSDAFADEQLRQTLQCIRCSACLNHCPVYARIGGHAYGSVYPGPIGKILTPHLTGLEVAKALPGASSLCGACADVCPVKIPIPALLLRLRQQSTAMSGRTVEALIWRVWGFIHKRPTRYRIMTYLLTRLAFLLPKRLKPWSQSRVLPKVAAKSLHERVKAMEKVK